MAPTKIRKSEFWIWTTLWITSIIDSALLTLLFGLVLAFILKDKQVLLILNSILQIVALVLGTYLAVQYVTKKSVIFKTEATKFAFLAVVVPVIFNVVFWATGQSVDILQFAKLIVMLGIIFILTRYLILQKGD